MKKYKIWKCINFKLNLIKFKIEFKKKFILNNTTLKLNLSRCCTLVKIYLIFSMCIWTYYSKL